jgi:hypothetical protein
MLKKSNGISLHVIKEQLSLHFPDAEKTEFNLTEI